MILFPALNFIYLSLNIDLTLYVLVSEENLDLIHYSEQTYFIVLSFNITSEFDTIGTIYLNHI